MVNSTRFFLYCSRGIIRGSGRKAFFFPEVAVLSCIDSWESAVSGIDVICIFGGLNFATIGTITSVILVI